MVIGKDATRGGGVGERETLKMRVRLVNFVGATCPSRFLRCVQVRRETGELLSHGAKQPLNLGIDGMHNIISPWWRLFNDMGLAGTCVAIWERKALDEIGPQNKTPLVRACKRIDGMLC
jgi:hypothetical protein